MPHNTRSVTSRIRSLHAAALLLNSLLMVLSVDIAGVFNILPLAAILALKDSITCILVACALSWLQLTLNFVKSANSQHQHTSHYSVLWIVALPATANIALCLLFTALAVKYNQQYFRGYWILSMGILVIGIAMATAMCLIIFIDAIKSAPHKDAKGIIRFKLIVGCLAFAALGSLDIIIAIRVSKLRETLEQAQLRSPDSYTPYWEGILFVLGIAMTMYASWLPLRPISSSRLQIVDEQSPLNMGEAVGRYYSQMSHISEVDREFIEQQITQKISKSIEDRSPSSDHKTDFSFFRSY
jgi:hypothetical protein